MPSPSSPLSLSFASDFSLLLPCPVLIPFSSSSSPSYGWGRAPFHLHVSSSSFSSFFLISYHFPSSFSLTSFPPPPFPVLFYILLCLNHSFFPLACSSLCPPHPPHSVSPFLCAFPGPPFLLPAVISSNLSPGGPVQGEKTLAGCGHARPSPRALRRLQLSQCLCEMLCSSPQT